MSERLSRSERLRRRIIVHLRTKWRFWEGDGSSWKSFAALARELREPVRCVKREVRRLHRSGVLSYGPLWNDEGLLEGRGYILTAEWDEHQPGRAGDPES